MKTYYIFKEKNCKYFQGKQKSVFWYSGIGRNVVAFFFFQYHTSWFTTVLFIWSQTQIAFCINLLFIICSDWCLVLIWTNHIALSHRTLPRPLPFPQNNNSDNNNRHLWFARHPLLYILIPPMWWHKCYYYPIYT